KFVFNQSGSIFVMADREKISQVIYNLIGNAIKYSPVGSVIMIEYLRIDNRLQVNVQDQGKGISFEDQQQIFERYYRVKNVNTGTIAGFGIGLYLCKEIIELHNGTISVQSSQNKGSVFSFTLPIDGL
ncbi:sensor histidine kinase, partial [Chryseobacterium sp. 2TAF14]|uniref:sensor histidine kinase n=1 Tax=Chryseobacterium sp. 2TAF14 TaxID=3233007 RepID=UPI003F8E4145